MMLGTGEGQLVRGKRNYCTQLKTTFDCKANSLVSILSQDVMKDHRKVCVI